MYLVQCELMDALELSIYLSLHFHRASAACVCGRVGRATEL